jgi:hypothetical protein
MHSAGLSVVGVLIGGGGVDDGEAEVESAIS